MENKKIIESFSSGRCPICALLRQDEFDYICEWVGVSDAKYRKAEKRIGLVKSKGFCNYHFWEFEHVSTHYGSAQVCIGFIEELIDILQNEKRENQFLNLQEYHHSLNCPLCADLKINESSHIEDLITLLDSQGNRTKYAKGWGLCIPHLIQTVLYANDESLTSFLLDSQKKQLERIKINAVGLIRKKEAPLRWEQTDDEKNSWFRAIQKLAGRRGQKN